MILFSNFSPRLEVAYPSFPSSRTAEAARDTKRLVLIYLSCAVVKEPPPRVTPARGKFSSFENFLGAPVPHGPDWARTSDPALIKRML